MRALIQRVSSASVSAPGAETRAIERGLVILLGVGPNDTEQTAEKLWAKARKLRIFEDGEGKTNLSIADVGGAVLLVSQFTLYADCRKGNRPSFTKGAAPAQAKALYEHFAAAVSADGVPLQTGWFGAHMTVSIENDGPFTIWLDSEALGMGNKI